MQQQIETSIIQCCPTTTLVRKLFSDYAYVNLELPEDRALAHEDPRSFLQRYTPPVVIDEIQRAPLLLSYIQVEIDENRLRKGRYIFTGSYQTELRSAVSQSLAGRTAMVYLLPLSPAELGSAGISLERDGSRRC